MHFISFLQLAVMACHHMFEVLLSDAFGPSNEPEILLFKRFKEKWFNLIYRQPKPSAVPLITACDSLKAFIADQLHIGHPRDDSREFLQLASWSGWFGRVDNGSKIWRPP